MAELKYNWEVVGHDKRLLELENELAENNLTHAYLFAGTDGIGKFSIAKRLANILQCENNYCHSCHVCQEIARGYHADTIEMPDTGGSVKIETVREILNRLHMSKQAPYKILLIQNIERMTPESGNAILKTLEDPPEKVIFLLTTGNVQEILPTILSRVRVYNFKRVSDRDVLTLLQQLYPLADPGHLETLSSLAMGKPGTAITFMEDAGVYEAYKKMYNDIAALVQKPDRVTQFVYITELINASKDEENDHMIRDFLEVLTAVLRKEMVELAQDKKKAGKMVGVIKDVQRAHHLLKRNVNKKLLLENLMLQL